jgi:hypothetical protein
MGRRRLADRRHPQRRQPRRGQRPLRGERRQRHPGADYTPLSGHVVFGDGDSDPREIQLQILSDAVAEPDKTVQLTLSEPGGCATLGARSSAELRILDDDRPLPTPTLYSVGGNLAGLVGGSVVLREVVSGSELTLAANGSFGFDRPQASGASYDVRVVTQPTSPIQVCNVRTGAAPFPRAIHRRVGDLHAASADRQRPRCVVRQPRARRPPRFRAAAGRSGLQRDGRIVVLGPTGLMRFHGDGALDASLATAARRRSTSRARSSARRPRPWSCRPTTASSSPG